MRFRLSFVEKAVNISAAAIHFGDHKANENNDFNGGARPAMQPGRNN